MNFTLNILGTASALPTMKRYPSAQVLDVRGRLFLFDCGEGTQMQMRRMRLSYLNICTVCLSHLHGDHVFGIFGLLSTMALMGRTAHLDKMRAARAALKRNRGADVVYMRHNVLRFCDVFARAGFPVPEPEAEERIVRPVPEVFGKKTGRWAGYAPFASKALKIYPEEQSRELAGMMSAEFDRLFIFSGPGREKEFLSSLNPLQEEAVRASDRAVAVIAGPGAGKTKTLIARLQYLVEADGSVTVRDVLEATDKRLCRRVLKAMEEAPRWQPALKDGEGVATDHVLRITLPEGRTLPREREIAI